ncbi:MAG: histone deacetylase family protein [Pseudomonadota bacterium]
MHTLYLSHPECELHSMGEKHPESPKRLQSLNAAVNAASWDSPLLMEQAPLLNVANLASAHPQHYIDAIVEQSPSEGTVSLDADTIMNPHSLNAALLAAGAGVNATARIINGEVRNAFCAVRPPGHHAESAIAMGFCIFNSVALAAEQALASGLKRVAILDFDVHHGNGTVEIFKDRPEVLVCSSFQWPFYPGRFDQLDRPNIVLSPLKEGDGSDEFRSAINRDWANAIKNHQPEMIFVSAGFDAHAADPLAGLNLHEQDYQWVGEQIVDWADQYSEQRVMAILEGGYNLDALALSGVRFITALSQQG